MKDSQIQALSKTSVTTKTKVIVSALILAGFGFIAYGSGFMPFIGKGSIGKIDTEILMKTKGSLKASKDTSLIGGSGSIAPKAEIIFSDGYEPSTHVYTQSDDVRSHYIFIDKVVGLEPGESYLIEINGCFKSGGDGSPIPFIANKRGEIGSSIMVEAFVPPHVDIPGCWTGVGPYNDLAFYKRTSINVHKKSLVGFSSIGLKEKKSETLDTLGGSKSYGKEHVDPGMVHSVVARRTWVDIDIAPFEHPDKFGAPLSTMDYFHSDTSIIKKAIFLGMTPIGIDGPLDDLMSKAVSSGEGVKINSTISDEPDDVDCVDIEDAFDSLIDSEEAIAELESGVRVRVSEMTDEELIEFLGEGGYVVEDGMSSADLAAEATMLGVDVVSTMTPLDFDVELCLKSGNINARLNEILVVGPVSVDAKSGEENIEARIHGGIPFGGLVDISLPAVVEVSVGMFGISISVPIPIPASATECNGAILNVTANHNSDSELRVGVSGRNIGVSQQTTGEYGMGDDFSMDYDGTGICEVGDVQDWLGGIENKIKYKIKQKLEDPDHNKILASALSATFDAYEIGNNSLIPSDDFRLETAKFDGVLSGYKPRVEAGDFTSEAFFETHGTDWSGFGASVDVSVLPVKKDTVLKRFTNKFFGNSGGLPSPKHMIPGEEGNHNRFSVSTSLINQLFHAASRGYLTFSPEPTYRDLHICTQEGSSKTGIDACSWTMISGISEECICGGGAKEKMGQAHLSRENLMEFIPEFAELKPGSMVEIKMYSNLAPTVAMPVNMYDSGLTPAVFSFTDHAIDFIVRSTGRTSKDRVLLRLGVDLLDPNFSPGFEAEDGRLDSRLSPMFHVMVLDHDFKTFPDDTHMTSDMRHFINKFVLNKMMYILSQIPTPEFHELSSYDGLACSVSDHEDTYRNPAHISMFSNLSCGR